MNPLNQKSDNDHSTPDVWTNAPWQSAAVSAQAAERLSKQLSVPLRVARWLCLRTQDEVEAAQWVAPLHQLAPLDEALFHEMSMATDRIWQAILQREKICIVGDYDVDGVTSSVIVAEVLAAYGADWMCLIPHRVEDGYGLSPDLVRRAHDRGASLLITVDNGIRAAAAVELAHSLGMAVVVTDHHEPGVELPGAATAVIHWARADDVDAVKRLSGAGVARKLADALYKSAAAHGVNAHVDLAALADWQDGLAALGALADVMPMRGENRRLVKRGVDALQACVRPGWLALCQQAGAPPNTLTASSLLWHITPRLNAAGRMGSAEVAFDLLMARSTESAAEAAQQVEAWNRTRRQVTDEAARAAISECDTRYADGLPGGLVVAGPWPLGVVGIVAARLCDHYQRPAIVLSDDGGLQLRGSGRAPAGFALYETVSACAAYLDHFGGHEAAIGCGVDRDKLNDFRAAFSAAADACWGGLVTGPGGTAGQGQIGLLADDYLPLSEASLEMAQWAEQLGPFGPENPPLTFYIGPVEIVQVRRMGQNQKHLRIIVREASTDAELVWFRADEQALAWKPGMRIAAVVELEENIWQGIRRVQMRVQTAACLPGVLGRAEFSQMYRLLRARRQVQLHDVESAQAVHTGQIAHLQVIFDTFVELGFARQVESAYHIINPVHSRDLRESPSYQRYLAHAGCTSPSAAGETPQVDSVDE